MAKANPGKRAQQELRRRWVLLLMSGATQPPPSWAFRNGWARRSRLRALIQDAMKRHRDAYLSQLFGAGLRNEWRTTLIWVDADTRLALHERYDHTTLEQINEETCEEVEVAYSVSEASLRLTMEGGSCTSPLATLEVLNAIESAIATAECQKTFRSRSA